MFRFTNFEIFDWIMPKTLMALEAEFLCLVEGHQPDKKTSSSCQDTTNIINF